MPKLPVVSGRETARALKRAGFVVVRQKGSHVMLWHEERNRAVTVPVHGNKELAPGTLAGVLDEAGLTVEEFIRLLGR